MEKRKWSDEEIQILKDNQYLTAKELQELLPDRSINSIYGARRSWGVSKSIKLTEEDLNYLQEHYKTMSPAELGEKLGVHRTTIKRTLKKMGFMSIHPDTWYLNKAESSIDEGEFSVTLSFSRRKLNEWNN